MKKGFTLIESLCVIVMISIFSVSIVCLTRFIRTSNKRNDYIDNSFNNFYELYSILSYSSQVEPIRICNYSDMFEFTNGFVAMFIKLNDYIILNDNAIDLKVYEVSFTQTYLCMSIDLLNKSTKLILEGKFVEV